MVKKKLSMSSSPRSKMKHKRKGKGKGVDESKSKGSKPQSHTHPPGDQVSPSVQCGTSGAVSTILSSEFSCTSVNLMDSVMNHLWISDMRPHVLVPHNYHYKPTYLKLDAFA